MSAAPLTAHPHIFIDTGLELHFDQEGRLAEIEVTWVYDELYSLLVTEDFGLDPDFDGVLTPAEQASLVGFDMRWVPGFNGDLVVEQNGAKLRLSGPMDYTAHYEDGRITTTHVRKFGAPIETVSEIELKPFDPTYYTAYDVTRPVTMTGTSACDTEMRVPDIAARLAELRDVLASLDVNTTSEDENLPDVGSLLATAIVVSCDTS